MLVKNSTDVWGSPHLSGLREAAKNFGYDTEFVQSSESPDIRGLYAVFFKDRKAFGPITPDSVRKLYNENCREGGLNLEYRLFKLDGFDDFVTHEQIMTYLQNAEVINRAFRQNNVVPPRKISDNAVLYIKSYYANTFNEGIPQIKRAAYGEQLKGILRETLKHYDPEADKLIIEDYDTGLSAKDNARRPAEGRNQVTPAHLTRFAGNVESVYIRACHRDKIIRALNKTDYLYSVSPVIGEKNEGFADNELFGSAKDNDTRRFVLSYDANYASDVRKLYEKVMYPHLFTRPFETFSKTFGQVEHLQILNTSIERFSVLSREKKIPIIFDEHGDTSYVASIPVAYPTSYKKQMQSVLLEMSKESEKLRIADKGLPGRSTHPRQVFPDLEDLPPASSNPMMAEYMKNAKSIDELLSER